MIEVFYFFSMMVIGVYAPFFPPYLQGLGFSGRQISTVLSVMPALALIAPLGWAWIADRSKQHARILRIVCWGSCAGVVPLLFARRFPAIVLSYAGSALFYVGMGGLADSLAVARVRFGADYGRMRVWGSAGCMVAALLTGVILTARGPHPGGAPLVPALMLLALAAAGVASGRVRGTGETSARPQLGDLRRLFQDRRFRLLMIAAPLHWMCTAPYNAFFGIFVGDQHLSPVVLGLSFCIGIAGEMLVLALFTRLRRAFELDSLLAIAFAVSALRWVLVARTHGVAPLMALQLLHAFTFGLFWAAGIAVVGESTPPALRATGQALFVMSIVGLGNILGNFAAGAIYDRAGSVSAAFLAAGVAELVPLALALRARTRRRGGRDGDAGANAVMVTATTLPARAAASPPPGSRR